MHSTLKRTTHKSVVSLFLAVFIFTMLVSPALALEIRVDRDGNIHVSQGYVLGDDSEDSEDNEEDEDKKEEKKEEEKKESSRSFIPASERKELRVTLEDNKTKIEMKSKKSSQKFSEVVKAENLQMSFPAAEKEVEDEQETEGENEVGHENEVEREKSKKATELEREYAKKIREARQQRIKEVVELRERKEDGTQSLELNSRDVKAQLDGAEFVLDSETNEVTLTTPSGKKHVLTHLPDQALARMKEAGVISDDEFDIEDQELQAEATEDGVVYTAEVIEEKKFLSFFPRMVSEKVSLDDATGEVKRESTASSFWGRFLDSLSY